MTRRILGAGVLLMLAASVASAAEPTPRHPDQLTLAPFALALPAPVDTMLAGGIRVLVFENHDVPLVTVTARVAMGRRYLSPDHLAAYAIYSRLWDDGGAGNADPAALESQIAALGMTLSAWAGYEEGAVTAHLAREDLDAALPLWRDLLTDPGLDSERLDRTRAQLLKDLQGINDDPGRLARTWFRRLLHGPESPGGLTHTRADLEAVSRAQVATLHRRFVHPARTVIGVAGAISVGEALARLETLFADWRGPTDPAPLEPWRWESQTRPGVYLLPGDFEQCHVRMGRTVAGLTESSPDFAVAQLASFAVGYLRVYYTTRQEGLSYGTATMLNVGTDRSSFEGLGSTRPDQVIPLITAVRARIDALPDEPLDDFELETSRTFRLGSILEDFETANDAVTAYVSDVVTGRPAGYQRDLVARLQAASTADLAAVVPGWMTFGDQPVVLVVGMPEGGPESLEALGLGKVTVLEPVRFGE